MGQAEKECVAAKRCVTCGTEVSDPETVYVHRGWLCAVCFDLGFSKAGPAVTQRQLARAVHMILDRLDKVL